MLLFGPGRIRQEEIHQGHKQPGPKHLSREIAGHFVDTEFGKEELFLDPLGFRFLDSSNDLAVPSPTGGVTFSGLW